MDSKAFVALPVKCASAGREMEDMKNVLLALVVGATALAVNPAFGHGAKAQYGGVVATANDVSYELVSDGSGATIYVVDHDKAADTSKMSGKLTVLNGAEKSEVDLKPAGGNKLEAKSAKLTKGTKAIASLTGANGKVTTVRFSIK